MRGIIYLISEALLALVAVTSLIPVIGGEDPGAGATMEGGVTSELPEIDKAIIDETVIKSPVVTFDDDDDESYKDDDAGFNVEDLWLFQYDPVDIGYEQDVELEDGMVRQMKTLAIDPPVFEIKDFLSADECEHLMKLALERGLSTSQTVPDPAPSEEELEEIHQLFEEYDVNSDDRLDPRELREVVLLFPAAKGLELTEEHVKDLILLKLDQDGDRLIDFDEFVDTDTPEMEEEIKRWLVTDVSGEESDGEEAAKRSRARVSDQTWLDQSTSGDEVLLRLQDRVIGLTLLPSTIIQTSESLQVVRYEPGGHYHAHYDSNPLDDDLKCAHTYGIEDNDKNEDDDEDFSEKRLCRLATVLYYLNDVEEGGETAFPVADNETFTQETIDDSPHDIYDLSNHCHKSNVVVPPEKGKAIMWYNHYLNEETGWMGDNRNHSLHGGCDVIRGMKWIANNWITVDDQVYRQILLHRRHFSQAVPETGTSVPEEITRPNGNGRESAEDPLDAECTTPDTEQIAGSHVQEESFEGGSHSYQGDKRIEGRVRDDSPEGPANEEILRRHSREIIMEDDSNDNIHILREEIHQNIQQSHQNDEL